MSLGVVLSPTMRISVRLSALVVGGPTSASERVFGEVKLGGVAIPSRCLIASTGAIGAARIVDAALAGLLSVVLEAPALKRAAITALIMNSTVVVNKNSGGGGECKYALTIAILNLLIQILAIVQLVAVLVFQHYSRKKTVAVGSDVESVLEHVKSINKDKDF